MLRGIIFAFPYLRSQAAITILVAVVKAAPFRKPKTDKNADYLAAEGILPFHCYRCSDKT
jgi:hypothetical protein